jgi:hypothetical protein
MPLKLTYSGKIRRFGCLRFFNKNKMNGSIAIFCKNLCTDDTIKRAVRLSLVVAPILILINHYESIFHLRFTSIFFIKAVLTFLVPFSVSAYPSARAYESQEKINKPVGRQNNYL